MAVNSTFYIDAATFSLATSVYLDLALTNIAPDGFYKFGTVVRQQSSGVLLTATTCSTCPTPCGTSISGSGSQGVYKVNLDVGSTQTGAIRIKFNPSAIPDGIRVTYNGVVYNKLSSPNYGVKQSLNAGHYTIVGTTGYTSSCGSWYPAGAVQTNPVFLYNPSTSTFDATGTTQTDTITAGTSPDFFLSPTDVGDCWMIIPKPATTPSSLLIEMIGPCSGTGWSFAAYCPSNLSTFPSSNMFGAATIPCSTSMSNTYYFAKVHTAGDAYVGLYDYAFSDANGQYPLADGYYLTSNAGTTNKVIHVVNGVVTAITACI